MGVADSFQKSKIKIYTVTEMMRFISGDNGSVERNEKNSERAEYISSSLDPDALEGVDLNAIAECMGTLGKAVKFTSLIATTLRYVANKHVGTKLSSLCSMQIACEDTSIALVDGKFISLTLKEYSCPCGMMFEGFMAGSKNQLFWHPVNSFEPRWSAMTFRSGRDSVDGRP